MHVVRVRLVNRYGRKYFHSILVLRRIQKRITCTGKLLQIPIFAHAIAPAIPAIVNLGYGQHPTSGVLNTPSDLGCQQAALGFHLVSSLVRCSMKSIIRSRTFSWSINSGLNKPPFDKYSRIRPTRRRRGAGDACPDCIVTCRPPGLWRWMAHTDTNACAGHGISSATYEPCESRCGPYRSRTP